MKQLRIAFVALLAVAFAACVQNSGRHGQPDKQILSDNGEVVYMDSVANSVDMDSVNLIGVLADTIDYTVEAKLVQSLDSADYTISGDGIYGFCGDIVVFNKLSDNGEIIDSIRINREFLWNMIPEEEKIPQLSKKQFHISSLYQDSLSGDSQKFGIILMQFDTDFGYVFKYEFNSSNDTIYLTDECTWSNWSSEE